METMGCWQRQSLSLPRFVGIHETSHVGTIMANRVLNIALLKKMDTLSYQTKARRASGRD